MAKLSGFFMSTLLIVLCLWINVCHYPDAANGSRANVESAPPVEDVPQTVAPEQPVEDAPNEQGTPERQGGLLADVGVVPELLDVSAALPNATSGLAPTAVPPALTPASFPADGAEIDDAPSETKNGAPTFPSTSFDAPKTDAVPSNATTPTSETASAATQDARRSATKPRGAKYVRVPEAEIDAFSGGVRAARSSVDELRVVGATRAGRSTPVSPAP